MKKICTLLLLTSMSLVLFAQFKAEGVKKTKDQERKYDVYSDSENYRYEYKDGKTSEVVIFKPSENRIYVLDPEKKNYQVKECNGPFGRMNDPVQFYEAMKSEGEERVEGNEMVGYYECERRSIYKDDKKVLSSLYSEDLNFPMEIKSELDEDTRMKLENVQEWEPDSKKFEVPEDYVQVDQKMKGNKSMLNDRGEWDVEDANIPFKEILEKGDKIKISMPVADRYKLIMRNKENGSGELTYKLYKEGMALTEEVTDKAADEEKSIELSPGEEKLMTIDWQEDYELMLEVHKGKIEVEVSPEAE